MPPYTLQEKTCKDNVPKAIRSIISVSPAAFETRFILFVCIYAGMIEP